MHLQVPFIKLPFQFDGEALTNEINNLPESAWKPHPQGYTGNFAIPLVSVNGDATNDATCGKMRGTVHLQSLPYVQQIMSELNVPIGRSRLMRIDGNGEATAHVDTNYYWQTRVRIHIPIITTPGVKFLCKDDSVHMKSGECWIFDTWSVHNVINPDTTRRIHLVIDSVCSPTFWNSINSNIIQYKPYIKDKPYQLNFENFNQPMVMSPGEVSHWISFAFRECDHLKTSNLDDFILVSNICDEFNKSWVSTYAIFGTEISGYDVYKSLLVKFDKNLNSISNSLSAKNGVKVIDILRQLIVRAALNIEPPTKLPEIKQPMQVLPQKSRFDRPIFIISPPRSGSTLLYETLSQAPDLWSIGGESHHIIERIPSLNPVNNNYASNKLDETKATPMNIAEISHGFLTQLRDRNGVSARPNISNFRFLEKTPKNTLRIPFFNKAFTDAKFVVLHRNPRDVLSSMIDAWNSKKFVTYPKLPKWDNEYAWSLVLTEDWELLKDQPVHKIVAQQWISIIETMMIDLQKIPKEQFMIASYDELLKDPNQEISNICEFVDIKWDRELKDLPLSKYTLTPPDPDKWKHNESLLDGIYKYVNPTIEKYNKFIELHRKRVTPAKKPAFPIGNAVKDIVPPVTPPSKPEPFSSSYTDSMTGILNSTNSSLVVTTYQSGRTIFVRNDNGKVNTHLKSFNNPMGVGISQNKMAIATNNSIVEFHNQPGIAKQLSPDGKMDACFVQRKSNYTGNISVHEIGYIDDELWVVNTRFSCLSVIDDKNSFVPKWKPKFISKLEAADKCHLNGMCIDNNIIRYVTALAETDIHAGWRDHKADGGILIDIHSNEIACKGLSMPHSPRIYDGKVWVLESGKGTLTTIDVNNGKTTIVCELPGFTRGLAFSGNYAFIGLSQIRESVFGGLPILDRLTERLCGVWVVNIRTGNIEGFLRFNGTVQEIFDIQLLHGIKYPELLEPEDERSMNAFILPDKNFL